MLRKITLGLFAAASLGVAAVAPASAHGIHGLHGWGHGLAFASGLYINSVTDSCFQQQMVPTRHGSRLRTINVCAAY